MADEATNAELLGVLEEDPENEETLLVYADWLQARGEPRGELIVLQHRREQCPDDPALAMAEAALLREHRAALVGGMDRFPEAMQLEWRLGFIRAARIMRPEPEPPAAPPPYPPEPPPAFELLRALLRHPAASLLGQLEVGSFDDLDLQTAVSVLVEVGPRRTLCRLTLADLGEPDPWEPTTLGDLRELWPLYPRLRHLYLRAGQLELGPIHLPELRSLELHTSELTRSSARSLARASWPELERLGLHLDDCQATLEDLSPILGDGTPQLHELTLTRCGFADAFFQALVASPLAARLSWLDLSGGSFSDGAAALLLARRDRFPRLRDLFLLGSLVSEGMAGEVCRVFPDAMIGDGDIGEEPVYARGQQPGMDDDMAVGKRFITDLESQDGDPDR